MKSTAFRVSGGSIWAGVVLLSLLAPDLVSGSEHDHIPLAAITAWIWGVVATGYVVLLALTSRGAEADAEVSKFLGGTIAVIWGIATIVSLFGPKLVTGSDPTEIPVSALIAPPAAALATALACLFFAATRSRT